MDNALLEQVARLKIRLRRDAGLSLNTRRFFEEATYGLEMLERAEESDDVEVVVLAMELRHRMGWLPRVAPRPANDAHGRAPDDECTTSGRYLYGARS